MKSFFLLVIVVFGASVYIQDYSSPSHTAAVFEKKQRIAAADEQDRQDLMNVEKYFYQQTADDAFREYKGSAQTCMELVRANSPYAPSVCADAQTKRRHLEP